jgi:hypothetical protein
MTGSKMISKNPAGDLTKEDLFQDFLQCTKQALEAWEWRFQVEGMADLVFVEGEADADAARALRQSNAWKILSDLYEYAVNGVDGSDDERTSFLVTEGAEVLELVTTHNRAPSDRWEEIVATADGRFALDDGQYIDIRRLALVANVDVRTVRNAVSAGDLESFKTDAGVFIENAHARRWLLGRKGFRPTVIRLEEVRPDLSQLETPVHVSAFLAARRPQLGKTIGDAPVFLQPAIEKLEAGVFDMALDVIGPLADYYQVPRKDLLQCVMRVFFFEELDLLTGGSDSQATNSHAPTTKTAKKSKSAKRDVPNYPNAGEF